VIGWLGAALALAEPQPTVVPRPPAVVELGQRWIVLDARVGDPLHTELRDPAAPYPHRWYLGRNAPPDFVIEENGTISYVPEQEDLGVWKVQIRVGGGNAPRWTGIELRVWPREETVLGPILAAAETVPEGEPARPGAFARVAQGCFLGLGVEAGAGKGPGSSWQHIGETGVRLTGSPHGSIACALGSPTAVWIVGVDSAPYVSYPMAEGEGRHALAVWTGAQFGAPTWKVGPVVTAGALLAGVGVRFQWLGIHLPLRPPMGIETRATWLPPSAVSASFGWSWAL
jgi:hypothetical protein